MGSDSGRAVLVLWLMGGAAVVGAIEAVKGSARWVVAGAQVIRRRPSGST